MSALAGGIAVCAGALECAGPVDPVTAAALVASDLLSDLRNAARRSASVGAEAELRPLAVVPFASRSRRAAGTWSAADKDGRPGEAVSLFRLALTGFASSPGPPTGRGSLDDEPHVSANFQVEIEFPNYM